MASTSQGVRGVSLSHALYNSVLPSSPCRALLAQLKSPSSHRWAGQALRPPALSCSAFSSFLQPHWLWGGSRQHVASEVPQSSRRVSALFLFPLQTTECTLGQPVGRHQTLPGLYNLLQEQGQSPVTTCTWLVLPCFTGCILRLSSTFQPPFPLQHLR